MSAEDNSSRPRPNFIREHIPGIALFAGCEFAYLGLGIKLSLVEHQPLSIEGWMALASIGFINGALLGIAGEPLLRIASGTLRLLSGQISLNDRVSEFLRLFWEPKTPKDTNSSIS